MPLFDTMLSFDIVLQAAFVIDGECPKCGRVVQKNHKRHLSRCSGRVEAQPIQLTEDEAKAQVCTP